VPPLLLPWVTLHPRALISPRSAPAPPQGGTRAAPRQFNDRNREEPANYWSDAANCSYAVTLRNRASGATIDTLGASMGQGVLGWRLCSSCG
jgi:hypothetical protein